MFQIHQIDYIFIYLLDKLERKISNKLISQRVCGLRAGVVPSVYCTLLFSQNSVLVMTMIDKDTSPASFLPPGQAAEVFYKLHCLCENDLNLSLRQRNLISLGYLLYGSADRMLLITTLQWVNPGLIVEVHQLMLKVCHKALLHIAEHPAGRHSGQLAQYSSLERLINANLRRLKRQEL